MVLEKLIKENNMKILKNLLITAGIILSLSSIVLVIIGNQNNAAFALIYAIIIKKILYRFF